MGKLSTIIFVRVLLVCDKILIYFRFIINLDYSYLCFFPSTNNHLLCLFDSVKLESKL